MFALTLRMLLMGTSVKVPAGAAGAAVARAGAPGAVAGVAAVVTACRRKRFIWHQHVLLNKTFSHTQCDTKIF